MSLADLLPTLLDALELPIPDGVQGQSLLAAISSESDWLDSFEHRMRVTSFDEEEVIRVGSRWKFGFRRVGDEQLERQLYDLESDPGEQNNLIGTPEGDARYDELVDRYGVWRASTQSEDAAYRILRGPPELGAEDQAELFGLGYGAGQSESD